MYKELLEKMCKVQIVETGDIVIPNAAAIAHDPNHKLGVWWYDLTSGRLLFSRIGIHSDFENFEDLMTKGVDKAIWVRGRVFSDGDGKRKCILVYTNDFEERGIRLTGQTLADIVQKVQDKSGLNIDIVVDDPGRLLYQE